MKQAKRVNPQTNRIAEEWLTLRRLINGETISGGRLTPLVWHLANAVNLATEGRYALVLRRDGEDVDPRELKYDEDIETLVVEEEEA